MSSSYKTPGEVLPEHGTRISLISLGCPKNLIDSEVILGHLATQGYTMTPSCGHADVVIINTCSFISAARHESYATIEQTSKQLSPDQKLVVCGCLTQLQRAALFARFPRINALLGSADYYQIAAVVQRLLAGENHLCCIGQPAFLADASWPRAVSTPPGYAYIKLSEGCSNHCSYCLIPRLRGPYRSRNLADVVTEAQNLVEMGIKELILTAQDTSFYGWDQGDNRRLTRLLRQLEDIPGLTWVRMLYAHPAHLRPGLLQHMAASHQFLSYLDIPLQHTHDDVLRAMNRPSFATARAALDLARSLVPDIVLRTTLLVGFPGETVQHFDKLVHDVEELAFDWLGAFTYSREPGTPSFDLPNTVPEETKVQRLETLMEMQKGITTRANRERLGQVYSVLVDRDIDEQAGGAMGHAWFQAPEIDGVSYLSRPAPAGTLQPAVVTRVRDAFDVVASPLAATSK